MSDNPLPVVIAPHVQGMGRPTKYDPIYCDRVVEWGKLGKSKAWICAELDIARTTLDLWITTWPDFSYAMEISLVHSQRWWEDSGQNALDGKPFNSPVWQKNMASRFKDWREKTANEFSGPEGKPIQVESIDALNLIQSRIDIIIAKRGQGEGT